MSAQLHSVNLFRKESYVSVYNTFYIIHFIQTHVSVLVFSVIRSYTLAFSIQFIMAVVFQQIKRQIPTVSCYQTLNFYYECMCFFNMQTELNYKLYLTMILENVGQHEHVYSYLWRMVLVRRCVCIKENIKRQCSRYRDKTSVGECTTYIVEITGANCVCVLFTSLFKIRFFNHDQHELSKT